MSGLIKVSREFCFEDRPELLPHLQNEDAYKLGYEDGILIGMEKEADGRKSVLSVEDMTSMVSVYDAVQNLKTTILGSRKEYWEEGGVLALFENFREKF